MKCVCVSVWETSQGRTLRPNHAARVFKHLRLILGSYLTRALGAVVHRPLVHVLVDDAVVETDAPVAVDVSPDQLVLVRL